MVQKTNSSFIRRFYRSRLFLVVSLLILCLVAFGYFRAYYQDYKIKEEIKLLQDEIDNLKVKKLESLDILKYVTSQEFVEEKARTELNLKKPGEKMIIMKQEDDLKITNNSAVSTEEPLTNPRKWWNYFWR